MIAWTTPTLKCSIPKEVEFDYLVLTLKSKNTKLEKKIDSSEIDNGKFNITLSQEETAMFSNSVVVDAQVNIIQDETRLASNILRLQICSNLHNEVMNNG